jgi:DNA-binding NarL/FixJ family response regulator
VHDSETFLRIATEFLRRHDEFGAVSAICRGEEMLAQVPDPRPQVILFGLDAPALAAMKTISCLRRILPDADIIALTLPEGNAYRQAVVAVVAMGGG